MISDDAYSSLKKTDSIVVFEGVTSLNKVSFGRWIVETDFCQTILACAAIEAPYDATSTLADVKDEEAKKEILFYKDFYERG